MSPLILISELFEGDWSASRHVGFIGRKNTVTHWICGCMRWLEVCTKTHTLKNL